MLETTATLATKTTAKPSAKVMLASVGLADHLRAQAGDSEAQFNQTLAYVTNAYYQAYAHGQRTQLNDANAACANYNTTAKAKLGGFASPLKAGAFYAAFGAALAVHGVPAKVKGVDNEACMTLAVDVAEQVMLFVTSALAPKPKASKELTDHKPSAKVKAAPTPTHTELNAAMLKPSSAPTLASSVQDTLQALRTGLLSSADLQALLVAVVESQPVALVAVVHDALLDGTFDAEAEADIAVALTTVAIAREQAFVTTDHAPASVMPQAAHA